MARRDEFARDDSDRYNNNILCSRSPSTDRFSCVSAAAHSCNTITSNYYHCAHTSLKQRIRIRTLQMACIVRLISYIMMVHRTVYYRALSAARAFVVEMDCIWVCERAAFFVIKHHIRHTCV